MAAKTIKGITVEIDGKTTKLNDAMKQAESPARSLESSLKSVNQALKLDPTNTELVAEKQKVLASYVDVTREKLETMESVQNQIRQQYATGKIDQGAYLDFQKELEYTKKKLLDLEKQQKEFGDTSKKALDEATKKSKDLKKGLDSVNKSLKLDPYNITLLKEKQKLLADSIEATREKLELMKEQQDKITADYASGDIDRGAYIEFQTELSATHQKLKDLKAQQKEFGDTSKIALEMATKECDDFEKGLNSVNEALKLDASNVTLLKEKQKLLADSIEATREKLELMKEQQDKITADYASGDIDRGAYLKFQTELSSTKQKLKELKEEQKEFGSVVTQVMQNAGTVVSGFGDKVSAVGKKLLPVSTAIAAAGVAAVNAGSDIIESQNKVEVAFGESADGIKEFADETLDVYGIAEGTALDMAALFGDMATSMEIPQDAAARMAESLVGLAGDLASFKNAELETVQNALKGIFTGETESLKNLGVVMTQDALLRFAMQQGMIDTTKSAEQLEEEEIALQKAQIDLEKAQTACNEAIKEHGENSIEAREADLKVRDATLSLSEAEAALNESVKGSLDTLSTAELVQLRYAFVLNATENAQGDFARTSDGAANSMRVASEAIKEVAADFGTLLAPYAAQAAQMVSELLKSIIALPEGQKEVILIIAATVAALGPALIVGGKVISGLGKIIYFVGELPALMTAAQTGITALSGVMSGAFTGAIGSVSAALSFLAANPIVLTIAALVAAIVGLAVLIGKKGDEIQDGLHKVDNYVQNVFAKDWTKTFGPVLGGVMNSFMDYLKNWWDAGVEFFDGIIDFIRGIFTGDWERAWEGVQKIFSGALNGVLALAGTSMEDVKEAFSSGIEKIKKLFSFDWEWPKLKMPHFSVTGGFDFSTFPPSLPKIGVEWYAKGGILNGAQIFGTLGNTLLGGGEAGPEAVLPLSSFYDNLRDILSQFVGNSAMSNVVNVSIHIEHFENTREQDMEELAEDVAERIQFKVMQKEAGLT